MQNPVSAMKDLNSNKIPYHRPLFSAYGSISQITQQGTGTRIIDNVSTNAMSGSTR